MIYLYLLIQMKYCLACWKPAGMQTPEKRPEDVFNAYMNVGGTIPGMESVESSRDAYTDVGGRKRPEQVFERRPGKCWEQLFEASCIRDFSTSLEMTRTQKCVRSESAYDQKLPNY